MCRSREACTEEYAHVAGVGFVMRAKMLPAGRLTRAMEREAKEPEECSTRRRRARSGWTQAGMRLLRSLARVEDELTVLCADAMIDFCVSLVGGGAELAVTAGDILEDIYDRLETVSTVSTMLKF
jgi:aryl-alcohol dehydrogenase-like predicted oxidoreductase